MGCKPSKPAKAADVLDGPSPIKAADVKLDSDASTGSIATTASEGAEGATVDSWAQMEQAEELEFLAEEAGDDTIMKALKSHFPHRVSSEDGSAESLHSTIWDDIYRHCLCT